MPAGNTFVKRPTEYRHATAAEHLGHFFRLPCTVDHNHSPISAYIAATERHFMREHGLITGQREIKNGHCSKGVEQQSDLAHVQ